MDKQISYNKKIHNKIAKKYAKKHPDIFNNIEQNRIKVSLTKAVDFIQTDSQTKLFLDYGCGDGNLTNHLLKFGQNVTAADVSESFLLLIKELYPYENLSTLLLNGENLNNVESNKYDLVAIYSVLHHIPDYLSALNDICRVIKKGGVLYIDMEACPTYWKPSDILKEFQQKVNKKNNLKLILNLFNPKWYIRKYNKIKNPKWQIEGDIHVWEDDHIEWDLIHDLLRKNDFNILLETDYLRYHPSYPQEIYNYYKDKCSDLRCMIARKS